MKNNWEETTLNDICKKIFAGGDKPVNFSKIENKKYSIPVVANGIENDGLLGFTDVATVIDKAITISARGTIGFVCKRNQPFCPIVRLIVVVPKQEKATIDFLYYLLQTLIPKSNGSSIPQLTVPNFKYSKIKLPPLHQQKKIVKKLDKAFADIDKLTEIAKQNLENSKELFNSYLNKLFTENKDWEETTLEKVADIITGTTPDTKNELYWNGKEYWITPAEIQEDLSYINNTNRKITKTAIKDCSLRCMPKGTVIFSSRAPIGKIAISNVDNLYCNQGFKNFICSNKIFNKFLCYFLLYKKDYIISLGKGTTFKEVSKKIVSDIKIKLPPLQQQKQIVKILDELQEKTKKLEEIYNKKIELAKELKQSILHKELSNN